MSSFFLLSVNTDTYTFRIEKCDEPVESLIETAKKIQLILEHSHLMRCSHLPHEFPAMMFCPYDFSSTFITQVVWNTALKIAHQNHPEGLRDLSPEDSLLCYIVNYTLEDIGQDPDHPFNALYTINSETPRSLLRRDVLR